MRNLLIINTGKLIFKRTTIEGHNYLEPYASKFSRNLFRKFIKLLGKFAKQREESILKLTDFKRIINEIINLINEKNQDFILSISNTIHPRKNNLDIDNVARILIEDTGNLNGDIQIVHPVRFYHLNKDNGMLNFGFVIHLPFDTGDKYCREKHEIFKKLDIFGKFSKYDYDSIPCYYFNCGVNVDLIYDTTTSILKNLYGYTDETKTHFDAEIYGSIDNKV